MHARAAASRVLEEVIERGHSLSAELPASLARLDRLEERGMLQELCYGVLRWHGRLQALTELLLARPLKARDADIQFLVLIGLYQLLEMRLAAPLAVDATVAASDELGKPWARALLNAVLRRFLRERDSLIERVDARPAARLAHPEWLLARLRADWPDHWERLAEANNRRAPMVLRVNRRLVDADGYKARLLEVGLSARALCGAPEALVLDMPVDVARLPGFSEGLVSVQDGAAQLAAHLLDARPSERVLDACAAPGGKACHLLELCPQLREVVALDNDPQRLLRVRENLSRLGLQATVLQGDARAPSNWWDGEFFDRILLDAPCSATGVVRRHPDIKVLRQSDDLARFAEQQSLMLEALWPLLRPGGLLLYATCSVLREENECQIRQFLAARQDGTVRPIKAAWGHDVGPGRQILTGEGDMDGFFYAIIEKSS